MPAERSVRQTVLQMRIQCKVREPWEEGMLPHTHAPVVQENYTIQKWLNPKVVRLRKIENREEKSNAPEFNSPRDQYEGRDANWAGQCSDFEDPAFQFWWESGFVVRFTLYLTIYCNWMPGVSLYAARLWTQEASM